MALDLAEGEEEPAAAVRSRSSAPRARRPGLRDAEAIIFINFFKKYFLCLKKYYFFRFLFANTSLIPYRASIGRIPVSDTYPVREWQQNAVSVHHAARRMNRIRNRFIVVVVILFLFLT